MKKKIFKIVLYVLIALSPLLYYQFRKYLPAYNRRPMVYEILFLVPYIFYFITAFLGIKLNQTRIFFTSLLWVNIYYLINNSYLPYIDFDFNQIQLLKLLSLFIFLTIVLLYVFKEKYILGLYGLVRILFVFAPIVLAVYLAKDITPGMYPYLMEHPLFDYDFWFLPDLVLIVLIGLITLFILQKDKSIHHFKYAIYVNLLPLLLSLNFTVGEGKIYIETGIFNLFSFSIMGVVFLYALYRMYWEKVYIDELTGIPNRRAFDEYLKKLGRKYTIAMIDIDHFKKFNDKYGHTEGDNVLRFVAKHIADEADGPAFRYGGEEFSVIYKGAQTKHVLKVLDIMRDNLASKIFYLRISEDIRKSKTKKDRRRNHANTKMAKVTISVGVAHKTPAKKEPHDVIVTADKALYKAKENGRNQVVKIQV